MKKILKVILIIWLFYLIYLNFFYKGTKALCQMGLPAASAITIAFFASVLWVGLPISYILKYLFSKFRRLFFTKNEFLGVFFNAIKITLFLFLFPIIFGMLIVFKLFNVNNNIFSNHYLFFAFQVFGLVYIYLGFSGKFNKYLLK